MTMTHTDVTMNNGTHLHPKHRITIINGQRIDGTAQDQGLMSASAACKLIGCKADDIRRKMHQLGIPIVALGGAAGGIYLVRETDVYDYIAKRDTEKAKAEEKAKAKSKSKAKTKPETDVQPTPVEETVTVESVNEFIKEVDQRLDALESRSARLESKLDKLLAVWGVDKE